MEEIEVQSYPQHLVPSCSTCNNGTVYFPFLVSVFRTLGGKQRLHSRNMYYVTSNECANPMLYIGLSPDKVGKAVFCCTQLLLELEGNANIEDWQYKIELQTPMRVVPPKNYIPL